MAEEQSGFVGWLGQVSDTVLDVGGDVAVLWAEKEFAPETPVEKQPAPSGALTAAAPVVAAGVPAPTTVNVFGFPLDSRALMVAGGALAAAVILKLLK